jgi:hypothetical protein
MPPSPARDSTLTLSTRTTPMAGYSGTPLPRKLGIKPGHRVALARAPAGFREGLDGLPADVAVETDEAGSGRLDVAVLFCPDLRALREGWEPLAGRLRPDGALWVAWPKKASRVPTDLAGDAVRALGLERGWVDVKVCAIDEVWSGLKFVVRLRDRPAGKGG